MNNKFIADSHVLCHNNAVPFQLPHVLQTTHTYSCDNVNKNTNNINSNNINNDSNASIINEKNNYLQNISYSDNKNFSHACNSAYLNNITSSLNLPDRNTSYVQNSSSPISSKYKIVYEDNSDTNNNNNNNSNRS